MQATGPAGHRLRRIALIGATAALTVVGVLPRPARAQGTTSAPAATPSTETPAATPPAQPPVTAGQDGIAVQSANGDFRLQIGLLLHADGRFALDDSNDQYIDSFVVRRLRPYLRGRIGRRFEFFVNPDFAGITAAVQDAYIDTIFSPAFRLRLGKAKTPFGMERLHSAANMLFGERAFPTAIAPNRDVGVQVLGDVGGGVVSYLGGVMNGVADGASGDTDNNDAKDLAGRVIVRPFVRNTDTPLRGLGLALSGTVGTESGILALPVLRTQILQQIYFTYLGATANGQRRRYSPQAFYFYKTFGGWFEYVKSTVPVREDDVEQRIAHRAWQVAGSVVLTGEPATDATIGVRPRTPFDFGNGHWGAFQVAARYHTLEVDDAAIALGFAAPASSRKAAAWTIGLNWYLSANVRYTFNFERTVFDDDPNGPRKPEDGAFFRLQLGF